VASGGSALLGGFGRAGVGESVGVVPYRWGSGLPVSGNSQESFRNRSGFELPNRSQETLRKLPALFCPCVGASVRPISQMRVGASASANSNRQIDLTTDGRWGSLVFTASVPSRAQSTHTSLLGARILIRN